ncbi:MAG: FeoA family protein [Hydrogeniiclostridium sp.]
MQRTFPMTQMEKNTTAWVERLNCSGSMRRRLQDIGLIEGTRVECLFRRVKGGPTAYLIRGAVIALRPSDSDRILVSGRRSI